MCAVSLRTKLAVPSCWQYAGLLLPSELYRQGTQLPAGVYDKRRVSGQSGLCERKM